MDLLFLKVSHLYGSLCLLDPCSIPKIIKQHELLNELADLIDKGKLTTTLTERLEPINAKNLRAVHEKMEACRSIGKIVLENF